MDMNKFIKNVAALETYGKDIVARARELVDDHDGGMEIVTKIRKTKDGVTKEIVLSQNFPEEG